MTRPTITLPAPRPGRVLVVIIDQAASVVWQLEPADLTDAARFHSGCHDLLQLLAAQRDARLAGMHESGTA